MKPKQKDPTQKDFHNEMKELLCHLLSPPRYSA
jgi:hypothetical protein